MEVIKSTTTAFPKLDSLFLSCKHSYIKKYKKSFIPSESLGIIIENKELSGFFSSKPITEILKNVGTLNIKYTPFVYWRGVSLTASLKISLSAKAF